jgi:hypothetical protein
VLMRGTRRRGDWRGWRVRGRVGGGVRIFISVEGEIGSGGLRDRVTDGLRDGW